MPQPKVLRLILGDQKVFYLRLNDRQNLQTIPANLQHLLTTQKFVRVEYLLPDEYRLDV